MTLRVFASAWGNATHWGSLGRLMDGLKSKGFAGLEASLSDLGDDADARAETAKQAQDRGLELVVGLYSHWTDYEGGWSPVDPSQHLDQLRRQVDACAALDATHINVHAGCDSWHEDVSTRFFEDAQRIVPANASFETHRGRPLGHAFQCKRILDAVPGLRLTADPSHWHVVHERMAPRFLDGHVDAVAARVDHVHCRIGNTQRPQLAAPFAETSAESIDWHLAFWRRCWDAGARTACVEYGPAPYQTTGDFRGLWLQNCAAKSHIEAAFAAWGEEPSPNLAAARCLGGSGLIKIITLSRSKAAERRRRRARGSRMRRRNTSALK